MDSDQKPSDDELNEDLYDIITHDDSGYALNEYDTSTSQVQPDKGLSELLKEILAFFHEVRQTCLDYRTLGRCCDIVHYKNCNNTGDYCKGTCLCYIAGTVYDYPIHSDGRMLEIFFNNCSHPYSPSCLYNVCSDSNVQSLRMPALLAFARRIREYDKDAVNNAIKGYLALDKSE